MNFKQDKPSQSVGVGSRLSQYHDTQLHKKYAVALISPYAQY